MNFKCSHIEVAEEIESMVSEMLGTQGNFKEILIKNIKNHDSEFKGVEYELIVEKASIDINTAKRLLHIDNKIVKRKTLRKIMVAYCFTNWEKIQTYWAYPILPQEEKAEIFDICFVEAIKIWEGKHSEEIPKEYLHDIHDYITSKYHIENLYHI